MTDKPKATEKKATKGAAQPNPGSGTPGARKYEKTPLFTAIHAGRYQRQELLRQIEADHPTLLCFVAGHDAPISRDDCKGFVDMLYNVQPGTPLDLLLHTPGGDVDAAEKLISLVRARVGEDIPFRVIVPDYAKSAGTLMALGGDVIVMSNSSELGTIDPQVYLRDRSGNEFSQSVLSYISAHDEAERDLRTHPDDIAARMTFDKFEPATLRQFKMIEKRARDFAGNQLKRLGVNYTAIVAELMNTSLYASHGQMINWEAAEKMGLKVKYMDDQDPVWRAYWQLYLLQVTSLEADQKMFESSFVSLTL